MSLDFEDDGPVVRGVMRSGGNVDEVPVVVLGFVFGKGLMDSRVDELVVVLFLAKR